MSLYLVYHYQKSINWRLLPVSAHLCLSTFLCLLSFAVLQQRTVHPSNIWQDPAAALFHSLRAVQIDDSIERISGSPLATREPKHCVSSAEFNRGTMLDTYSSPSKSAGIGNLNMSSTNSSPHAERHKQIMESPTWRRKDSFVRQVHAQVDDPFVSSGNGPTSGPGKYLYYLIR